jgi:hypothetical protein
MRCPASSVLLIVNLVAFGSALVLGIVAVVLQRRALMQRIECGRAAAPLGEQPTLPRGML